MSDTIAVFVPSDEIVPIEELHELTAIDEIALLKDDNENLRGYHIEWDDVQLEIRFPGEAVQNRKLDEFHDIYSDLLKGRRDKKARKVLRRADRMIQYIECEVTPDWDKSRKAQLLVQGVMAYFDYALMLANETLYNENGNIIIGREGSKLKYWAEELEKGETDAPDERKKASLQILNRENVPYIKHLPNLADDEVFNLRSVEEIVKRAIALNLISRRADGESAKWFAQKVTQYQLEDSITEEENLFNEDDSPEDYILIMFSQRMEACWLLLWALRLLPELSRPNNFASSERANEIVDSRSLDQFLIESKLRSKSEILDALDLHLRYHWAVIDAELYGKKAPAGLKPDAVYQRHYALNWLTQFRDEAWDDVTTDT